MRIKLEHLLIIIIVLIGLYLLMNRCRCNEFSVGGVVPKWQVRDVFTNNIHQVFVHAKDIDDAIDEFESMGLDLMKDLHIIERVNEAADTDSGASGGAAAGTAAAGGDDFLNNMKGALETITSSKWSTKSLTIDQQECRGNNAFFYHCYLEKLIKALPELKKDKFFWVDGHGHSYIIYDEDGEIGNHINISPNDEVQNQPGHFETPDNSNRRIIIDKSQNFIGYVKDGFKPAEKWADANANTPYCCNLLIPLVGKDGLFFERAIFQDFSKNSSDFFLPDIEELCSKPFECRR